MLVSNLDFDTHKGKIAIGRIWRGKVSPHDHLVVLGPDNAQTPFGRRLAAFPFPVVPVAEQFARILHAVCHLTRVRAAGLCHGVFATMERIGAYLQRPIGELEVRAADELWLVASTKEVLPIVSLDGAPGASGQPGPVFARMYDWYQEFKREVMHG